MYVKHKKYINELNDYINIIDNYDFRKYVSIKILMIIQ